MMTMEEALETLGEKPDRKTLELYIAHAWVRPLEREKKWHFEEIDIARTQLVYHLHRGLEMQHEAVDMVLHLLDQVYGMREQMRRMRHALEKQPHSLREELLNLLEETRHDYMDV